MASARVISYGDISRDMTCERSYVVTPEVYDTFVSIFGDRSPIHVDADYAISCGFADRVMHGGILNGFISHFVGMVFPGANSLLLSVELRFLQPTYLGDTLRLHAQVASKLDAEQVVVLHMTFYNETRGLKAATGRVQVKVRQT